ncbi:MULTISPECIES: cupredoxin domain-containing protein [Vreelandella]|uniref:cupredoxin domain-containing protein n=1 Tax=Vreelandella TaxID=3137766 RepID=UPI00105B453A|nr:MULTISPECIES: plastocyanin/azurin family copper-binding protein [Halomonas]MBR9923389.1 copper-binding protein [Gammaproteobacteria bacterium]MDW0359858.1 plastocyanin/azurin family copper-binding protein [Halomonas venusta]TDV99873.1 putative cupredoxin-like copper-binding protein [Halomonas alkaliantarctica]UQI39234.1 plastocyanin/azurin family copper-binding protein [Halomonas venusta]
MRYTLLTTSLFALSLSLITGAALAAPGHGGGGNNLTEADVDRTISLEAGDMWFDPEELELAAGEVVKFEITNTGNLEHEFVIGSKEAQEEHRQMMLNMANGGGHDMSNMSHGGGHDMASMDMAGVTIAPGETGTLLWSVPDNVNELEYACNIPGHYESGMYGNFSL